MNLSSYRTLVLAPVGQDGRLVERALRDARLEVLCCLDLPAVLEELQKGAGVLLLTEEALREGEIERLRQTLAGQPAWSDLPLVLLTRAGHENRLSLLALEVFSNVTLLERPMRMLHLVSAVRSALRARERQYQIRDQLERLERTEGELRVSNARLEQLLASISDAFFAFDAGGRVTYANFPAEVLFGRRVDDLRNHDVWEALGRRLPEDAVTALRAAARERHAARLEYVPLENDGWVDVRAYPYDSGMSLYVTDVTARRRGEEERKARELERRLEEQTRAERQHLGRELHDGVRQQLSGMKMLASILQRKLAKREMEEAELLEEFTGLITEANEQVRHLIGGLVPQTVSVESLAPALRRAARYAERWYGILVTADLPDELPADASLDDWQANHLFLIAQEAVANAAKHSGASEITVALRVDADGVELEVQDDGEGLPDDFERRGGAGVTNMRYRAELVGATFHIDGSQGVRVHCRVPRREPALAEGVGAA